MLTGAVTALNSGWKGKKRLHVRLYTDWCVCVCMWGWMHRSSGDVFHLLPLLTRIFFLMFCFLLSSLCPFFSSFKLLFSDLVIFLPRYRHLSDLISFIFLLTYISVSPHVQSSIPSILCIYFLLLSSTPDPSLLSLLSLVSMLCVCVCVCVCPGVF